MPAIPKIPETAEEYQSFIKYLRSKTVPKDIQLNPIPSSKSNFIRRCKKFEIDKNGILYISTVVKDGVIKSEKCHVIPKYDEGLHTLILVRFHDQANHRNYHKINVIDAFVASYNSIIHTAHNRTPHEAMFGWKMHCVYATPNIIQDASEENNDVVIISEAAASEENSDVVITFEAAMEKHISQMLKVQQSVNASLEEYRTKKSQKGSVHKKKTANNMIEVRTAIAIVPDHDMNTQTRKRKLQLTFSQRDVFKMLTSNNHTAIIEVNGKKVRVPVT